MSPAESRTVKRVIRLVLSTPPPEGLRSRMKLAVPPFLSVSTRNTPSWFLSRFCTRYDLPTWLSPNTAAAGLTSKALAIRPTATRPPIILSRVCPSASGPRKALAQFRPARDACFSASIRRSMAPVDILFMIQVLIISLTAFSYTQM